MNTDAGAGFSPEIQRTSSSGETLFAAERRQGATQGADGDGVFGHDALTRVSISRRLENVFRQP